MLRRRSVNNPACLYSQSYGNEFLITSNPFYTSLSLSCPFKLNYKSFPPTFFHILEARNRHKGLSCSWEQSFDRSDKSGGTMASESNSSSAFRRMCIMADSSFLSVTEAAEEKFRDSLLTGYLRLGSDIPPSFGHDIWGTSEHSEGLYPKVSHCTMYSQMLHFSMIVLRKREKGITINLQPSRINNLSPIGG